MPLKRNPFPILLLAATLVAAALWLQRDRAPVAEGAGPPPVAIDASGQRAGASTWPTFLPQEARPVLRRIADGGPHPYRQDGSVFQNREGRLPSHPRGYYREYTVETPGLGHRGARRIVTGGQPPAVYYYSDDHYDSFRRFEPPREATP
ncbi:MAG: ribonuclease [Luteimonas sp.]|nr:ribonuclease [Luteimonas sp.]